MRGRPRKPTEQHKLHGTFRNDRHAEEVAGGGDAAPVKPKSLKGEAEELWDRVVPQLVKSGIAKERDCEALVSMCQWWALYKKYSKALGGMASTNKRILIVAGLASMCQKHFSKLAAAFGLTPGDRARLHVDKPAKSTGIPKRERK